MKQSRVYTKEILEEAVKISLNFSHLCRVLGKYPKGATYELIRNRVKDYGIDTSHFLGQATHTGFRHTGSAKTKSPELVLVKGYKYRLGSRKIRRALLNSGVEYKCKECGIRSWLNKDITLQVDHIDGDWSNCEKENLRFLCPNCHTQTSTHSGKNKKGI